MSIGMKIHGQIFTQQQLELIGIFLLKPLEKKVQIEKIGKYIYKLEPATEVSGDSYTSELSQLFIRREWDLPEILCDISSKGGSLVVRLSR